MRRLLLPTLVVFAASAAGCEPGYLAGPSVDESSSTAADVGFPCDVRGVLETYCAGCHTGETYAPDFLTRQDLLTPWGSGGSLGETAAMLVEQEKMPLGTAVPRPSADERAILIDWVAAGMPAGPCGPLTPPPRP